MNDLWVFLGKFKDPAMALLALTTVGLLYLLITLQRCYNALLKTSVRSVTLLQVLVFGKKAATINEDDE
jgi:hypothetical protein